MLTVKNITQKLEDAVIADKPDEKIVERHEIPMTIDDFLVKKTHANLEQLKNVLFDAEEFFQNLKLGDKPTPLETLERLN